MPFFHRTGDRTYLPTEHVGGGWAADEQHIAPALGLMAHVVEQDRDARRDDGPVLTRLSYDILGVLPLEEVEVIPRVVRAGRTIELVEAVLTHADRPAVVLRAWLQTSRPTGAIAGTPLPALPPPARLEPWDPTTVWPGGFIAAAEVRRHEEVPGRASFWVRSDVTLVDEPTSRTADVLGLVDIANGMSVRESPAQVAFPNLDLTAHLFRTPAAGWVGLDTSVSFGPAGHGLTSSVLHDERGPFGTLAQTLTVRPV